MYLYWNKNTTMMTDEEMMNDLNKRLKELQEIMKSKLVEFLNGRTVEQVKEDLHYSTDEELEWLCENIALEHEYYEVCIAAQSLIAERKKKP